MAAAEERLGNLRRLRTEIRRDMDAIRSLNAHLRELVAEIDPGRTATWRNQMAIALSLHHIYTGAEELFQRIVNTYDHARYERSDWHRQLLINMSEELETVRPQVITADLRRDLDRYRAFRHVVRHAYDQELRWEELSHLALGMDPVVHRLEAEINNFLRFVEEGIAMAERASNGQ